LPFAPRDHRGRIQQWRIRPEESGQADAKPLMEAPAMEGECWARIGKALLEALNQNGE
jgi:hypothetical protein